MLAIKPLANKLKLLINQTQLEGWCIRCNRQLLLNKQSNEMVDSNKCNVLRGQ